ncbi:MAG TPA: hypothetical protein VHU23_06740 [Rhizomicrobium sp.]|jgi:hypothetical protein|nr:hypothetical protein [Rhizomicrobium sp.]
MAWSWDFLVQVFRGLGGTIDNVARKPGRGGRGLVSIQPDKPAGIHVPANLLVPLSDLEFADGRITLKKDAAAGSGERTFLENYLNDLSWESGGKAEASAFIAGLDGLPSEVKQVLSEEFAMNAFFEGGEERARNWFLESRRLGWRDKPVIAPFIELAEHDSTSAPCVDHDGLALVGMFPEGVRTLRSEADPITFFRRFGYASPEPTAFSQPMAAEPQGCKIEIRKKINRDATLGSTRVPEFTRDGDSLLASCLMLGSVPRPMVPRSIFKAMASGMPLASADQTFDFIQHRNRMIFLGLLEVLEPYEGNMVAELRSVARYQLQAMSFCIGVREL